MRVFQLHPDAENRYDPPVESMLRQIPSVTSNMEEADVVLVPVVRLDDFKFRESLYDLKKPWVLVDYTENGWNWDQEQTQFYGKNTAKFFGERYNEEWAKFDKWVTDHPPLLTFKRELLEKDRTDRVLPIEYTHWLPEFGIDTKDDFLKRTLEVSYNFGRSHEGRMWMHGAVFSCAPSLGYGVVSEFSHVEKEPKESRKWLSVHTPWYARIDVREVQKFNRMARCSIIMPGCGVKTFRAGECCLDSIMAMPKSGLAWAYPWDNSNSIPLPPIASIESAVDSVCSINLRLADSNLYELYCRAMENGRLYRYERYLRFWVMANIERFL